MEAAAAKPSPSTVSTVPVPPPSLCGECNGQSSDCAACWFRPREQQLESEFTIAPGVSWLHVQWDPFRLGCLVCAAFGSSTGQRSSYQNTMASNRERLKPRALKAHEKSVKHVRALKAQKADPRFESLDPLPDDHSSPSTAAFRKAVAHLRKHPLGQTGIAGVASKTKGRQLMWCLAEAHRDIKREIWASSSGLVSASFFQDTRHGKLSIRFTAASMSPLRRRSGHLATLVLASGVQYRLCGHQRRNFGSH